MAGREAVSISDKKKAKFTCKLFAGFAAFFLLSSALLVAFTPRSTAVKGINNKESDTLRSVSDCNYGETFVVSSKDNLQRYKTNGVKSFQTIAYASEITSMCQGNGDLFENNVFNDVIGHYVNVGDAGYYLVIDGDGDIFRYDDQKLANGNYQFTLNNDYWLTERVLIKGSTYKAKYNLRSIDVKGDYLYALYTFESTYVGMKFEVNNLHNGPIATKTLYSIATPDKDQALNYNESVYIIDPVNSDKGENVYSIAATDDYLYIFTSYGLNRWSLDFKDSITASGETISFLGDGVDALVSVLRDELLNMEASIKEEYQITDAMINSAGNFIIRQMYQIIFGNKEYVNREMSSAKQFKNTHDWVVNYDPTVNSESLAIKYKYAKPSYNLPVRVNGDQTMGGVAYSSKDEVLYYLDIRNKYLYKATLSTLNDYSLDDVRDLTSAASKTAISYAGYSFSDIKGNIQYDENSGNIHVLFYSSRKISIIDLSSERPSKKYTFDFEYDIRYFFENQDGTRVGAFYQTEKRTLDNVASFPLHFAVINPDTYQYRNVYTVLFVISVVLCVVSLVTFFISMKAYQKTMTLLKLKVIGRDLKKNKFTYLALVPYVTLLIMFCWVEAIGSISFSFFNYTMQKPSYIWNSFGNYIEIFNDKNFGLMLGNTAFFLVFDLFLCIVPPIFFAFCLSVIKNKKLSGVLRALMFIPAIVPGIASLLIWKVGIFGDTGVLNQIICLFKNGTTSADNYVPINFLHNTDISRWSLLLMGFPYVGGYLIFYGGIMNVPKEYDEACQLEGVSVVKRFITIDLPLIKPQIKYIFVMGILSSVQNYERTYMLGSSGTTTLVESMYRQMKDVANPNYGLSSAYATIIFALLLLPVLWNFRNTKKNTMGDAL